MKFTILTLFPEVISQYINTSIIARARENNLVQFEIIDLREFGEGKRRNVDDTVYGGGSGMVITVPVLDRALGSIKDVLEAKIIYLSPKGKVLEQKKLREVSLDSTHYVLICGHYEGIDERIFKLYNIEEVSIGDYILTGGELAALVFIDGVVRLIPGSIKEDSSADESLENILLEQPQYTKPLEYKGLKVPKILVSGDHGKVDEYRIQEKINETKKKRPDLYERYIETNKLD